MRVLHLWTFSTTFAFLASTAPAVQAGGAEDELKAKVERRVRDWQPTKDERLLDQVGWAGGLVEARQLAKEHQRPLFVFTYDGCATRANALAIQRC
jgi:hypothetical protein